MHSRKVRLTDVPCSLCDRTGTCKINWRGDLICSHCAGDLLRWQQLLDDDRTLALVVEAWTDAQNGHQRFTT